MANVIFDIVTSRKGGAGKTLVSLFKLDQAMLRNIDTLALDINDMNPDLYMILNRLLGTLGHLEKELDLCYLRDKYIQVEKVSWPRVRCFEGESYSVDNIRLRRKVSSTYVSKPVGIKISKKKRTTSSDYLARLSMLDLLVAFKDVIEISSYARRRSRKNKGKVYTIIDTNTVYRSHRYLMVERYRASSKNLGEISVENFPFVRSMFTRLSNVNRCIVSQMEKLAKKFAEEKSIIALTYIPPIDVFLDLTKQKLFSREMQYLSDFIENIPVKTIPHIIANMYLPIDKSTLRTIRFLEGDIDQLARSMKESIDPVLDKIRENGYNRDRDPKKGLFLGLSDIKDILEKIPEEKIEEHVNRRFRKKGRKERIAILLKLLVLEKCLFFLGKEGTKILNLTVMPIFNFDLAHIVEIFRSPILEDIISEIMQNDIYSKNFWSNYMHYGLFSGFIPFLNIPIKSSKTPEDWVWMDGILMQFIENLGSFIEEIMNAD